MKQVILFLFLFLAPLAYAQTLTLDQCQELAKENYPLVSQKGLLEQSAEFTVSNAKRNWLPQVSLLAQATYQSEVVTLPDKFSDMLGVLGMEFEGLHKDQYKAAIEISQVIYGGGAVKAQVEMAKAESEANSQNWEVEMYGLRERVNQLFFGTLLLQEKTKETDILIEELDRNEQLVRAYIQNGVGSQNDLDQITVEQLTARQQRSELIATQKAYRTMLGIMTGKEITDDIQLQKPEMAIVAQDAMFNRPELRYFDAQEKMLDAQIKGINSAIKPQIGAFFQGAYANPGLDLFKDMEKNQWSPYFITGIKLQWNISGFYTRGNNLSQLNLNRSLISNQRETFLYNINLQSTQQNIAVNRMHEVMKDDDEIINLRTSIRQRTEVGVQNGTQTVNDLLRDLHAESLARQNKVTHEIELLKNIYDLKYTTNN